jgi:hypothetical protein
MMNTPLLIHSSDRLCSEFLAHMGAYLSYRQYRSDLLEDCADHIASLIDLY